MQIPGKQYYSPLIFAGLINLLLFIAFICFTSPIYDTNEDVYILYQLSGGAGSPPTELLHYNHIVSPLIGIIIKKLFLFSGQVNWYAVILFLSHYVACTVIACQIIKRKSTALAILSYLTVFIVFESQLLLTINFSNTALVLGLAGITLLTTWSGTKSIKQLILAGLLLLAGSLFRIHVLIPLAGIALPFLLFPYYRKRLIAVIGTLTITACAILLMNQAHQAYYRSNIQQWEKEETHRQFIFSFYNNRTLHQPLPGEKWYTEFNLIQGGLPIDTSFLSDKVLSQMLTELKTASITTKAVAGDSKNWFFINNRIFFCTVLILFFLAGFDKKHMLLSAASLVLIVGGLAFLNFNYKLPGYLVIASLYLLSLLILQSPLQKQATFHPLLYIPLLLSMTTWGIVRICKNNHRNLKEIASFKETYQTLASFPENLFIITADGLPLQKFYVFDLPRKYPFTNILNSENFMNNTYLPTLNRYGCKDVQLIPDHNHIFFWGEKAKAIENYFTLVSGKKATTVNTDQFKSEKGYRIIFNEITGKDSSDRP